MNNPPPNWILYASLLLPLSAQSQLVISDTLTGASSSYGWQIFNGACLTAGNGTGTIPACIGLPYYSGKTQVGGTTGRLPDAVGQGSLRLTNGDTGAGSNGNNQSGAVISTNPFPSDQGLQVTFTTVTYGGNGFKNSNNQSSGADGIAFFLSDWAQPASIGGLGGSLGYSCSNVNDVYNGVQGGYIGIGIDEYGNFTNSGDNTASGSGAKPGSISVRSAGNVNWSWLNANYPSLYPNSLSSSSQKNAVQTTCRTGKLYNASSSSQTVVVNGVSTSISSGASSNIPVLDYPLLATNQLPSTVTLFNQEAKSTPLRGGAQPITYGLTITKNGVLNMSYSFNGGVGVPVVTNQSIVAANGAVPAAFRFGFSGSTGGGSNVHEITCFKAAQMDVAVNSAGVNVQQSARVEAGTQVYLAFYHPTNWWGQLTATSLIYTAATDTVDLSTTINWDTNCGLTGGVCASTGTSNTAQGSVSRNLLTWNGSAGIPLQWASLSPSLATSFANASLLAYLRGDRTNEAVPNGTTGFRARTGVLGDIINSSPTWVGAPSLPYKGPWQDALYSAVMPEGVSYTTFSQNNATRTNVVYIGSNDGFLHGFRAGAYKNDGTFDAMAPNDGLELLGYMPAAVNATIHNPTGILDFPSTQYAHAAFVDATPGTGDLFYGGAWHTWLVGGLGPGGNTGGPINDATSTATNSSFFALDITSPSNFNEANAASLVLGDWGPTSLPICVATPVNCKVNMGNTYGTPIIRRLHDGNWAVIFGNGFNSSTGTAGIFIMTVKQSDGSKSFRFLDTGYGPAKDPLNQNSKNGIAYVSSADLDDDHVTDFVYAGDLFGNVWRFDLTSSTASNWAVGANPMFSTPAGQPITSAVTVSSIPSKTGPARVLIAFGTGQKLPQTTTSAATYATLVAQSLYGVWDWNMSSWNLKSPVKYASLAAPQTVTPSVLQVQTATNVAGSSGNISGYRTVTVLPICWRGLTICASGQNTMYGWRLTLPSSSEQILYNPTIFNGLFTVNTTIPGVNNALTCGIQLPSGYTMAISLDTGGSPSSSFFSNATKNYVSVNGLIISGIGLSATGTPSFVSALKKPYMINQTIMGTGSITQVNPAAAKGGGKRINWIKLR